MEYFGAFSGLLYLFLEIRQHRAMWIVGILTSLFYIFVFFFSKIYADMGLNVYYVAISIYGFRQWTQGTKQEEILYRTLTPRLFARVLLAIAALFALLHNILYRFTDSPVPVGDAFTTAVGIVATWMVARRIIEHWIFWIVANSVSVWLYYQRGLYPTLFLYTCYTILAAVGWYAWKKKGTKRHDNTL